MELGDTIHSERTKSMGRTVSSNGVAIGAYCFDSRRGKAYIYDVDLPTSYPSPSPSIQKVSKEFVRFLVSLYQNWINSVHMCRLVGT